MDRDLRDTPLYREIEDHFRRALEPGFGRVSGADHLDVEPGGRRAAFTGGRRAALEGNAIDRICVLDLESGALEEVTAGPNDDRLPRWSPDGGRIAFLSDRSQAGRMQAYLLETDRLGEAVALPEVPGTVESVAWSPDGTRLLLGSAGLGADQAGASGSGVTKGADPLPSWIPSVEGDGENEWRRLWVLDLGSRSLRGLSGEKTNVWEAAWCGTDAVVAIVSDAPGEDAWYDAVLVRIDAATGESRELARSDVQLGVPVANADGSRAAVIEALCSDRVLVAGTLLVVDPAGEGVSRIDTGAVDVSDATWLDRDRLLVAGLRGMETVVGVADAATGAFEERWATTEGSGFWFPTARPVDADAFALVLDSYARPPAVVVVRDGAPRTVVELRARGDAVPRGRDRSCGAHHVGGARRARDRGPARPAGRLPGPTRWS